MKALNLKHVLVCGAALIVMILFSACAGVGSGSTTLTGSIVSASGTTVVIDVNGQQDTITNVPANIVQQLSSQVGKVYTIDVNASGSGSFTFTSVEAHSNTVQKTVQQNNQPIFSPYVLVIPATGACHTGGIQVQPGATFTAETNGQSVPVSLDSATHTATFPTLPTNSWVTVQVPAHTDLRLADCDGVINVQGITGQMNLSANTIVASQVDLLGSSHLHVNNGTITFNGRLDSNSIDLFDDQNGFISVTLPKADPFHIDAVTAAGNISTTLGTPTPSGQSGSQLHTSSQPAPGAQLTVNETAGSMNFTIQ